jgi:serine phosphatase RsbU (regulator of sigma subunit)
MIGIFRELHIDPAITRLEPGDTALLYSDGLVSSKTATGERHTADTLSAAFGDLGARTDFLPTLIAQLDQLSGGGGFDDDVAAIALRRE